MLLHCPTTPISETTNWDYLVFSTSALLQTTFFFHHTCSWRWAFCYLETPSWHIYINWITSVNRSKCFLEFLRDTHRNEFWENPSFSPRVKCRSHIVSILSAAVYSMWACLRFSCLNCRSIKSSLVWHHKFHLDPDRPLGWMVWEWHAKNRMGTHSPVPQPMTSHRNKINQ